MLYKVTHRYYLGMLSFLNEEFARVGFFVFFFIFDLLQIKPSQKSEQELTLAFYNCHIDAHSNQEYVHHSIIIFSFLYQFLCLNFQTHLGIPDSASYFKRPSTLK